MKPLSQVACSALVLVLGSTAAFSQSAISARSGMVHQVEGKVMVGDQAIEAKIGNFPQVKENQTLRTEEGRAEVLLTPGVFLRVGENSSFKMITDRLIDTRLEFLAGSMIVESDDLLKDNSVTIVAKDATVRLRKQGIYRFDSEPARLRVFKGTADVEANGKTTELSAGRLLSLGGDMAVSKFDAKDTDALDRWSYRRAEYLAMANVSAAKSLSSSSSGYLGSGVGMYGGGYGYGYCGSMTSSLWAWNPYFGMFAYVPCNGSYLSPYGFRYWSPGTVYRVYQPRPVYAGNGGGNSGYNSSLGYNTASQTSSGYSGVASSVSSGASVGAMSAGPSAGASSSAGAGVSHSGGGSAGGGHR